jgi:hypothetical protein
MPVLDFGAPALLTRTLILQIGDKVAEQVDLKTLFQLPPAETQHLIDTGKAVLDTWSEVYLQVRGQAVLPMPNRGPCATTPARVAETEFALWAGLLLYGKETGLI